MKDFNQATYHAACVEIQFWKAGRTNFTCLLLTLIQHADRRNQERLRSAFPEVVQAFEDWEDAPDEAEFFRQHNERMQQLKDAKPT